jgi:hypothetical protein
MKLASQIWSSTCLIPTACPAKTRLRLRDDLVAGLAGDAELAAQRRYLLAIQNPRNEFETLVHAVAPPAKAPSLSSQRPKV